MSISSIVSAEEQVVRFDGGSPFVNPTPTAADAGLAGSRFPAGAVFRPCLDRAPAVPVKRIAQSHADTPTMTARRFPAPRTVEEYRGISYIVRDANRFPVACVYFENEPGRRAAAHLVTKDGARKIAAGIAKLPELLTRPP
jgi:hypothetical protein